MRLATLCLTLALTVPLFAQPKLTRDQKVRQDRQHVEDQGFWIYNDLEKARAEARKTGKPLIVALRCVPCEECVKLDDELVDENPKVRPLLEKFIRVRVVSTNGLDLSLFQFDTDQSFALFLMNADGTIYGRYGTRSHRTYWSDDVSVAGLADALEGALELHGDYPKNKAALAGKRGGKPLFASPEKFPSLKDRYTDTINFKGDVVRSCIHCHQIGDAVREFYWKQDHEIPETILFPYPHPKSQGLILDPSTKATVKEVEPSTSAAKAGFKAGDKLRTLEGQPILSIADVQWVLHNTPPEGKTVTATVERGGREVTLPWELAEGWRKLDDISWRVSSWGLRGMLTGGLVLEETPEEQRKKLGVGEDKLALHVKAAGQYNKHAAARRAGFRPGDILVSFGGVTNRMSEAGLFDHAQAKYKVGDRVPVEVLRDGKRLTLRLPIQD